VSYSTDADVLPFLPSGGLPNAARVARANATTDQIELDQHGFAAEQAVEFSADADYSVPGGLTAGTTYYVVAVSTSRFKVSATPGGSAIDLTSAGDNFAVWSELPFEAWRTWAQSIVDGLLPPHVVPIVPDDNGDYPAVVVASEAELAAAKGLSVTGGAEIDLGAKIDAIRIRLKDWAKGIPLRGADRSRTSPANLAIVGTVPTTGRGSAWVRTASDGSEVLP
jgi:hypothetical protein